MQKPWHILSIIILGMFAKLICNKFNEFFFLRFVYLLTVVCFIHFTERTFKLLSSWVCIFFLFCLLSKRIDIECDALL